LARTPKEAVERYAEPIRTTLTCITDAIVSYRGGVYPGKIHSLSFLNSSSIGRLFGTDLSLFFSQRYSLQQSSENEWKIKTEGYWYTVKDEEDKEILAYHWHPVDQPYKEPHLHLKMLAPSRGEFARAHVPTGRISIETLALFLIRDLYVKPHGTDWQAVIQRNHDLFEQSRNW
jgi:hypothetical protein